MTPLNQTPRWILLFGFVLGLSACGNGGDDDDDEQDITPDPPEPISLVSKNSAGFAGDMSTEDGSASSDGRYVAFSSRATNLVTGDGNAAEDVFVHDTQTGETTRVSVDSLGNEGNADSSGPSISGDGRYVLFNSGADNLVAADGNATSDIFLHDRQTGETSRISVDGAGSESNGSSSSARFSADGRFVVFQSNADNLVAGDTNTATDVFLRDLQGGTVSRVSTDSMGAEAGGGSGSPAVSADGRYVAFNSNASNLVADDTNGVSDIFVRDTQAGITERVSVGPGGLQADGSSRAPEISDDGRFVAFYSSANNLVTDDTNGVTDIFLHDRTSGETVRVSLASDGSEGDDASDTLAMSGDGRHVAFFSDATNMVAGDTNGESDVFVRDVDANETVRVSVAADGSEANDFSEVTGMSRDGRYVLIYSAASNLDPAANNMVNQLFRAPAR